MYEELVKRLRETTVNHNEKCESCSHEEEYPCCVDCLDEMHTEAADAIESTNKAYQMISEAYEAEVTKQNWIPVTERLPDSWDDNRWNECSHGIHFFVNKQEAVNW